MVKYSKEILKQQLTVLELKQFVDLSISLLTVCNYFDYWLVQVFFSSKGAHKLHPFWLLKWEYLLFF